MKKLILMGRVAAGKTTLTQALKGEQIHYCKTQYINYYDTIIDTPGEYTEVHALGAALAIYSYEADVVGIVISANEPFCVFPPACAAMVNREQPAAEIIREMFTEAEEVLKGAGKWVR